MKNKLLLPAITLFTILLLSFILGKSNLEKINKMRSANKENKKKLSRMLEKAEQLENLEENELSQKIEKVEEIYPSQKPVLKLIDSLYYLTEKLGVTFEGIELKPGKIAKEEQKETSFEINFMIKGTTQEVLKFIKEMETTPPLTLIEGLNVNLNLNEGKEEGQAVINFKARVYYQPLPEKIGRIEDPLPLLTEEEIAVLNQLENYQQLPAYEVLPSLGRENPFSLL